MPVPQPQKSYPALIAAIRNELRRGIEKAEEAVYQQRVITYWHIGRHTHEFLSDPSVRFETPHLVQIAADAGFSLDVMRKIVKFYRAFPKLPKKSRLSWNQYRAILSAPARLRPLLLKRAITENLGGEQLQALISLERHKKTAAVAGGKLRSSRGRLYIYKTIDDKHLKLKENEIMVDCGFKWRHQVNIKDDSKLTGGYMVRSVKTDNDYELRYCNEDPAWLYTYSATIERVIDADTLLLSIDAGFKNWVDLRVRLRGVDAPEMSTALGRRACEYVKKVLGTRGVVIKSYKDDKYGRYLVDLYYRKQHTNDPAVIAKEGLFLNQELLDRGLAKLYQDPQPIAAKPTDSTDAPEG